jgi:hypothetical protein
LREFCLQLIHRERLCDEVVHADCQATIAIGRGCVWRECRDGGTFAPSRLFHSSHRLYRRESVHLGHVQIPKYHLESHFAMEVHSGSAVLRSLYLMYGLNV